MSGNLTIVKDLTKILFAKRIEYRSLMREYLNIERETKISVVLHQMWIKMFWKLIKGKLC